MIWAQPRSGDVSVKFEANLLKMATTEVFIGELAKEF